MSTRSSGVSGRRSSGVSRRRSSRLSNKGRILSEFSPTGSYRELSSFFWNHLDISSETHAPILNEVSTDKTVAALSPQRINQLNISTPIHRKSGGSEQKKNSSEHVSPINKANISKEDNSRSVESSSFAGNMFHLKRRKFQNNKPRKVVNPYLETSKTLSVAAAAADQQIKELKPNAEKYITTSSVEKQTIQNSVNTMHSPDLPNQDNSDTTKDVEKQDVASSSDFSPAINMKLLKQTFTVKKNIFDEADSLTYKSSKKVINTNTSNFLNQKSHLIKAGNIYNEAAGRDTDECSDFSPQVTRRRFKRKLRDKINIFDEADSLTDKSGRQVSNTSTSNMLNQKSHLVRPGNIYNETAVGDTDECSVFSLQVTKRILKRNLREKKNIFDEAASLVVKSNMKANSSSLLNQESKSKKEVNYYEEAAQADTDHSSDKSPQVKKKRLKRISTKKKNIFDEAESLINKSSSSSSSKTSEHKGEEVNLSKNLYEEQKSTLQNRQTFHQSPDKQIDLYHDPENDASLSDEPELKSLQSSKARSHDKLITNLKEIESDEHMDVSVESHKPNIENKIYTDSSFHEKYQRNVYNKTPLLKNQIRISQSNESLKPTSINSSKIHHNNSISTNKDLVDSEFLPDDTPLGSSKLQLQKLSHTQTPHKSITHRSGAITIVSHNAKEQNNYKSKFQDNNKVTDFGEQDYRVSPSYESNRSATVDGRFVNIDISVESHKSNIEEQKSTLQNRQSFHQSPDQQIDLYQYTDSSFNERHLRNVYSSKDLIDNKSPLLTDQTRLSQNTESSKPTSAISRKIHHNNSISTSKDLVDSEFLPHDTPLGSSKLPSKKLFHTETPVKSINVRSSENTSVSQNSKEFINSKSNKNVTGFGEQDYYVSPSHDSHKSTVVDGTFVNIDVSVEGHKSNIEDKIYTGSSLNKRHLRNVYSSKDLIDDKAPLLTNQISLSQTKEFSKPKTNSSKIHRNNSISTSKDLVYSDFLPHDTPLGSSKLPSKKLFHTETPVKSINVRSSENTSVSQNSKEFINSKSNKNVTGFGEQDYYVSPSQDSHRSATVDVSAVRQKSKLEDKIYTNSSFSGRHQRNVYSSKIFSDTVPSLLEGISTENRVRQSSKISLSDSGKIRHNESVRKGLGNSNLSEGNAFSGSYRMLENKLMHEITPTDSTNDRLRNKTSVSSSVKTLLLSEDNETLSLTNNIHNGSENTLRNIEDCSRSLQVRNTPLKQNELNNMSMAFVEQNFIDKSTLIKSWLECQSPANEVEKSKELSGNKARLNEIGRDDFPEKQTCNEIFFDTTLDKGPTHEIVSIQSFDSSIQFNNVSHSTAIQESTKEHACEHSLKMRAKKNLHERHLLPNPIKNQFHDSIDEKGMNKTESKITNRFLNSTSPILVHGSYRHFLNDNSPIIGKYADEISKDWSEEDAKEFDSSKDVIRGTENKYISKRDSELSIVSHGITPEEQPSIIANPAETNSQKPGVTNTPKSNLSLDLQSENIENLNKDNITAETPYDDILSLMAKEDDFEAKYAIHCQWLKKQTECKERSNHDAKSKKKIKVKSEIQITVNGKPIRTPRLKKPQPWVTKEFYKMIINICEKEYGAWKSRKRAEEFVVYLCQNVQYACRRRKNYFHFVENVKRALFDIGIVTSYSDFVWFVRDYLTYDFRIRSVPNYLKLHLIERPEWDPNLDVDAPLYKSRKKFRKFQME